MLSKLYSWYGKTTVRIVLGVIAVLFGAGTMFSALGGNDTPDAPPAATQVVRTATIAELAGSDSSVSVIGTVEAVSEAEVRSETGGRITSVRAEIGDRVSAGTILATFENSQQRAAVLQAQGAYEAAQASAAQSDVSAESSAESLASARTAAWNTYRSAFISTDDVMRNTMDDLFSDYNRQVLNLQDFTWERRLIRYELEDWGAQSQTAMPAGDLIPYLVEGEALIDRLTVLIDDIYAQLTRMERTGNHESVVSIISTYKSELSTARSTLNSARSSLASAQSQLESAQAAYERAQIGGTGSTVSVADAQVKQALGSLRSAQSALEKTIVRSSIDGVVNSVFVKQGAYVGAASPIAEVVNTGALEITAFLSTADREQVAVGDTLQIEGGYEGTITRIAPSLNSATQKYEVKISPNTTELENGDVVRITLTTETSDAPASDAPLFLPLTAVKLTNDSAVVFTVNEGVLVAHEVTLGDVRGNSIAVHDGLSSDMELVTDARGLTAGTPVRIVD